MSGITIGQLPCAYQQEIAQKCDKNRDGKLTGNEITIFEQQKDEFGGNRNVSNNGNNWTIKEDHGDGSTSTTQIRKNENGTTVSTWQGGDISYHCTFDKNGIKRSETYHDGAHTSFESWDQNGNPIVSTRVDAADEEIPEDGTNFDVEG